MLCPAEDSDQESHFAINVPQETWKHVNINREFHSLICKHRICWVPQEAPEKQTFSYHVQTNPKREMTLEQMKSEIVTWIFPISSNGFDRSPEA